MKMITLLSFGSWFGELSGMDKTFWIFALIFTPILLIMMVLHFLGGDIDSDVPDVDLEIEGDPGVGGLFLTPRNFVGFFTVFGWTGISAIDLGFSSGISLLIAVLGGAFMMFIMGGIFYLMYKMVGSGTLKLENAIGGLGEVYMRIPAKKAGFGKVQIKVQGSLRTLEAVSEHYEDIPTGKLVKVVGIVNDQALLVSIE